MSDFDSVISGNDLAKTNRDTQLEVMRTWFSQNFEDPAERTPFDSQEGGYLWIWGGPYEPQEELEAEFCDLVSEDLIEELSNELESISWEWAPTPKPGDYDEFLVDDIAQITEFHNNFSSSILDIDALLEATVLSHVENSFHRLLYVNVITVLETYLSDAFINSVIPDKGLIRRFVENAPEFKSKKLPLSEVFKAAEEIEQKVKSHLADVVWHNLGRVKPMYLDVLGVSFPQDLGDLTRAVLKRHDIVHRNGKSKSGEEIIITKKDVIDLAHKVESFVQTIDQELSKVTAN